jgi:hypothetical protein
VTLGIAVFVVFVWGVLTVLAAVTRNEILVTMSSSLMPLMLLVAGGLLTDGWFRGIRKIKERDEGENGA